MSNPAADLATAMAALRIKTGRWRGVREGVELHQRGKPVLILTHENARRFAQEIAESEA